MERVRLLEWAPIKYVIFNLNILIFTEDKSLYRVTYPKRAGAHRPTYLLTSIVHFFLADYAVFHEGALANATQILQDQGKILGTNLKPISVQSF